MNFSLLLILATLQAGAAFHVLTRESSPATFLAMKKEDSMTVKADFQGGEPDMKRAKDCAEHFGKCSVKEMEKLRDDVHQKRVKNLVFGSDSGKVDALNERFIEDELSMQLSLLKEEMPPSYLFPEVEDDMEELPHLKDGTVAAKIVEEEKKFGLELLMEEGVLESIAFCTVLGALMLVPQVMN